MTEIKNKEGNKVFFDLVLPGEKVEESMEKIYKQEKHNITLPGFRKGKVPRKIFERAYGEDVFYEDAVNELIPDFYEAAAKELELELAGRPNITLANPYKKGEDTILNVEVEVLPEIKLKDYSKIEIPEYKYEVTDEMVEHQLEHEREHNARAIEIEDRPSEDGDTVNIDYTGFVDGEEFEGGKDENHSLKLGSGEFIEGFEEQLIGKNIGDEVNVKVTFPEDYHAEDLAGKDAEFVVMINGIQKIELPEVDDEFIKDISEFDTVEEYKANAKVALEEQARLSKENNERAAVLNKLTEYADFDVPDAIVENQIDMEINNFKQNLYNYGIDYDQYLEMVGHNEEAIRDDFREAAYNNAKGRIILDAITKKENIAVSDEEIDEEIDRLAEGYFANNEEKKKEFADKLKEERPEFIKLDLLDQKTLDLLMKNVVYVEIDEEENADSDVEENAEVAENSDSSEE